MTTSRRNLLKALGLGGVGLVAGMGVKDVLARPSRETQWPSRELQVPSRSLGACDLGHPPTISPLVKVGWGAPTADQLEMWEHPDMDLIEAVMLMKGGYPGYFGHFPADVTIHKTDMLKINYTVTVEQSERKLVLYRVYDAECSLTCIGTSLQGPVVKDDSTFFGHRLATIEEMVPNEEESLKGNQHR